MLYLDDILYEKLIRFLSQIIVINVPSRYGSSYLILFSRAKFEHKFSTQTSNLVLIINNNWYKSLSHHTEFKQRSSDDRICQ